MSFKLPSQIFEVAVLIIKIKIKIKTKTLKYTQWSKAITFIFKSPKEMLQDTKPNTPIGTTS